MTESFQTAILTAIPVIITSLAAAYVQIRKSNDASAKTDARVDARAGEVKDKLGEVHEQVNGNLSAVASRLEVALQENIALREELARRDVANGSTPH